jgi:hypothetical protein
MISIDTEPRDVPPTSPWRSVLRGMGKGAKVGAIVVMPIVLTLCVIVFCTVGPAKDPQTPAEWSIVVGLILLGTLFYGVCGAIGGALVMFVVGFVRHRPPVRFSLRFLLALITAVCVVTGLLVWLCSPRLTTEDRVFIYLNLCCENRFEAAEAYLERYPEIATDPDAISGRPALYWAIQYHGDPRTAELLLDHGARADGEALWRAVEGNNPVAFKLLHDRGASLGPGNEDIERRLLEAVEADLANMDE